MQTQHSHNTQRSPKTPVAQREPSPAVKDSTEYKGTEHFCDHGSETYINDNGEFLTSNSFQNSGIQFKLTIGKPGDRYEEEADSVADHVMKMPETDSIQRRCLTCEEEDTVRGKPLMQRNQSSAKDTPLSNTNTIEQGLHTGTSAGQPLSDDVRNSMQSYFNTDFKDVRVHSDQNAIHLNRKLQAQAFTHGSNIYFNSGKYAPQSSSGKHLLAHELTHVVQQDKSNQSTTQKKRIQKKATDYQVLGQKAHDFETIFFKRNSKSLGWKGRRQIADIVRTHGATANLTLNGFKSEEETPATLSADRIDAVKKELKRNRSKAKFAADRHPPHTGTLATVDMASASAGVYDYRDYRKVEVLATPVGMAAAPSNTPASCVSPFACASMTPFDTGLVEANVWLAAAKTKVSTYNAATQALVSRFLNQGNPPPATAKADITTRLNALTTHLAGVRPQVECGLSCDADCGNSSAVNKGTGHRPAGSALGTSPRMLLCPSFISGGLTDRAADIIHEGLHGLTGGIDTEDYSYAHQRLIEVLPYAKAIDNSDSLVLLIQFLNSQSPTVGVAGDKQKWMGNATNKGKARRALAYLESWLIACYQSMQFLYSAIVDSNTAGTWQGSNASRRIMNKISSHFTLTNPGAPGAAYNAVNTTDQHNVAALQDRYYKMRAVMHGSPITLKKIKGSGKSKWKKGPKNTAFLTNHFFNLSDDTKRTKELVRAIAYATPYVSLSIIPKYVEAADIIRKEKGKGP